MVKIDQVLAEYGNFVLLIVAAAEAVVVALNEVVAELLLDLPVLADWF